MTHLKKSYTMQELTEVAHDIYNVDPSYTCISIEAMKEEGKSHYSYVKFEMTSDKPNMPMLTLEHDLLVVDKTPQLELPPIFEGAQVVMPDGTHHYQDRIVVVSSGTIDEIWNKPDNNQVAFELEAELSHA